MSGLSLYKNLFTPKSPWEFVEDEIRWEAILFRHGFLQAQPKKQHQQMILNWWWFFTRTRYHLQNPVKQRRHVFNKKNRSHHMGVSLNGGTPKTPQMIIFSRKTMIVGYHNFRKHPHLHPIFPRQKLESWTMWRPTRIPWNLSSVMVDTYSE